MTKDQMRKRIKAITGGFRSPSDGVVSPDKATKLALTIKGKMGGVNSAQELAMVALLSETAGVDVLSAYNRLPTPGTNNGGPWAKVMQPLVAVVALKAYNGSSIPLNVPVVFAESYTQSVAYNTSGCRAINSLGGFTGNMNAARIDELRLATDEEIDRLTDAQVDYFIKLYTA